MTCSPRLLNIFALFFIFAWAILSARTAAYTFSDELLGDSTQATVSLPEQAFIHLQSVANYRKTWQRLQDEGTPWDTFGVRAAFDHAFCLAASDSFFRRHPEYLSKPDELLADLRQKADGPSPDSAEILRDTAFLERVAELARDEFTARVPQERLLPLFQLGREMQITTDFRDPAFGNFRWYYHQQAVEDWNAVEFVCQRAIPIWMDHRAALGAEEEALLKTILTDCAEACRRHRVRSDYTNIALANITNLILLGELLGDDRILAEGLWRSRRFLLWTWKNGLTEYVSPTYYGVCAEALELLTHARHDEARRFAAAVLELLWTDIAANYHAPSARLAGAHSRSYNYLFGTDIFTENYFQKWRWDASRVSRPDVTTVSARQSGLAPSEALAHLNSAYPRTVIQKWSGELAGWRTCHLCPDITLSTSSAYYRAAQDAALVVDIPRREADFQAGKTRPRAYFIPDGRQDPYGQERFETSGGHRKALHLPCFWRAAQRQKDAICLAVYRPQDITSPHVTGVQSHFVFPVPDEILLDGVRVSLTEAACFPDSLSTLILRYDAAMLAIRVVWSQTQDGTAARAFLVPPKEGTDYMRLTLEHCATPFQTHPPKLSPAVALHVRIGSAMTCPEARDAWCRDFLHPKTPATVRIDKNAVHLAVQGETGPVALDVTGLAFTANFPLNAPTVFTPEYPEGILSVNGRELGRPILQRYSLMLQDYARGAGAALEAPE